MWLVGCVLSDLIVDCVCYLVVCFADWFWVLYLWVCLMGGLVCLFIVGVCSFYRLVGALGL